MIWSLSRNSLVWRALVLGLLFGFGWADLALADNCSGASDCASTVGFNAAAQAALFGGLGGFGAWLLGSGLFESGGRPSLFDYAEAFGEVLWEDFASGQARDRLLAFAEAVPQGFAEGAEGFVKSLGVAADFWAHATPQQVADAIKALPDAAKGAAEDFVRSMRELEAAATAKDTTKFGEMMGKMTGNAMFQAVLGEAMAQGTAALGEGLGGARAAAGVEEAATGGRVAEATTGARAAEAAEGLKGLPEGTPLTAERLGMPERNFEAIKNIADNPRPGHPNGVNVEVRPTNPEAATLLEQGHPPKPMDIKAKTINDLDVQLGANPVDKGKVGYFEPQRPPGEMPPALQKRFDQRMQEFGDQKYKMDKLVGEGKISIDDGVVVNRGLNSDPNTMGKAFTGDHDVFRITDRVTGQPVSPEVANQVIRDLKPYGVEHGAHMDWKPTTPVDQGIFDKIVNGHTAGTPGAEPLARFGAGDPAAVYHR